MRTDDKALFDLVPSEQSPESRREIMDILFKGIRDIELQLGTKSRTDSAGVRLSAEDYQIWRKNAIKAMNYRVALYRQYKALEKAASNESADAKNTNDTAAASIGCGEHCEAGA